MFDELDTPEEAAETRAFYDEIIPRDPDFELSIGEALVDGELSQLFACAVGVGSTET